MLAHLLPPFFRSYLTGSGRSLFVAAIDHRDHVEGFLTALSVTDAAKRLGFVRGSVLDDPARPGNLYAYRLSMRWVRLRRTISAALRHQDPIDVEQRLVDAGVPAGAHRTTQEFVGVPALIGSGVVIHPPAGHGPVVQPGPSSTSPAPRRGQRCRTRSPRRRPK
ncbi:hypothetical protein [Williamsia sp. R60]